MARPAHRYVLRDTVVVVTFWLATALGVVLVGDPLVRGDLPLVAATAPIVAIVLWVLWMLLFHPHVRYDDERVVVTNIGRVHDLPWSRVAVVRQNLTLTFELDDGRRIRAAGVSAPRGKGLMLGGLTRGKLGVGSEEFHRNSDALRPIQAAAARTDAPAVSRWDVIPLTIGGVLAIAVVIDLLVLLT
ncbi:hypothetical protein [Pseudolysinimonas sp.]|uniref:hypothetical protein n=1 Tax=Pseudolysinimonas sp. TaxID=2680009 RepID=UPI0037842B9D